MKTSFTALVIVLVLTSFACTAIAIISHSMSPALAAKGTMILAATIVAVYKLYRYAVKMSGKIAHKDASVPSAVPMFAFLGFFLVEVVLAVACAYLATHMWTVRDLLNFELTATLSGIIVCYLTKKA